MTPLPKTHVKKWKILIERLHLILFDWFRISDRSIQVEENPHKPLDFSVKGDQDRLADVNFTGPYQS